MAPSMPPYLYGPPSQTQARSQYSVVEPHDDFDPKAFTKASWSSQSGIQTKQNGPLLDFNKHPDSFLILPYGQTDAKAMGPNVKKTIKIVRWVQFGVRLLQLLGALGLLVCVICVKNTQDTEGYIIRVPPAVDIIMTSYGLYHLRRPAKGRTPASSSSYHLFALLIDLGLIPFYIFTAMVAKSKQDLDAADKLAWSSFFDYSGTQKIILSTWLISIVVGSLHLITGVVSVYLMRIFRKISYLPPDLNPLDRNVVPRRSNKHKYKNSELSAASMSERTLVGSSLSLARPYTSSPSKGSSAEPVPFLRTRVQSDFVYSPHTPRSAAMASRSQFLDPNTAQSPGMDAPQDCSRNNEVQHLQGNASDVSNRSHRLMSEPSVDETCFSDLSSYPRTSTMLSDAPPMVPRKSSKRHDILTDNWFVEGSRDGGKENGNPQITIVEDGDGDGDYDPYSTAQAGRPYDFRHLKPLGRTYQPLAQYQHDAPWESGQQDLSTAKSRESFVPMPLGMNPPTPPPNHALEVQQVRGGRPLSATTGNSVASPRRAGVETGTKHTPTKSVGTPTKSRFYGDLNSAMAGVRGASPSGSPATSPKKDGAGNMSSRTERQDWAREDGGRKGRVVSRTGADDQLGGGKAALRGRNVSGKVAEEGRGGPGWRQWGGER